MKELIFALPHVGAWPQMCQMVERVQSQSEVGVWNYPVAACEAVGASPDAALPGAAAILCSLISIHVVDDMLDADPAGDYLHLGAGSAANLAIAFQAAGHQLLDDDRLASSIRSDLHRTLSRMTLATAYGQSRELSAGGGEVRYWESAQAKTPPLFAAALSIGALLGGASAETAERLGCLGELLGLCVQVSDDLLDALRTPAATDWTNPHPNNLAILYALTAQHAEREAFLDLSTRTTTPEALRAAQEILVRCGALSYCSFKMLDFLGQARETLVGLNLSRPEPLTRLLDAHTEPLNRLFATAGATPGGAALPLLRP